MRAIPLLLLAAAGLAPPAPGAPPARELRIAAASDLKFALEEVLSASGGAERGPRPVVTYGSSGSFFAMIENGAPFDLFLSADADYPRRLARKGLADGEVFLYARGRLALWVPASSRLDVGTRGLRALLDPSVRTIALANPRHAPYGRAAEAALRSLGLYEAVRRKLVLGENVAQAAQFVESGAADAGLLALSLARSPRMRAAGRHVEVPPSSYPGIVQGGIVLKGARERAGAIALRDLLVGPRGREVLLRHGFAPPPR